MVSVKIDVAEKDPDLHLSSLVSRSPLDATEHKKHDEAQKCGEDGAQNVVAAAILGHIHEL
jgi:hypothetical protein